MFIVEKITKGKDGETVWKKDRTYKVFQNAEDRLYALYDQGINGRIIERHK